MFADQMKRTKGDTLVRTCACGSNTKKGNFRFSTREKKHNTQKALNILKQEINDNFYEISIFTRCNIFQSMNPLFENIEVILVF